MLRLICNKEVHTASRPVLLRSDVHGFSPNGYASSLPRPRASLSFAPVRPGAGGANRHALVSSKNDIIRFSRIIEKTKNAHRPNGRFWDKNNSLSFVKRLYRRTAKFSFSWQPEAPGDVLPNSRDSPENISSSMILLPLCDSVNQFNMKFFKNFKPATRLVLA